MVAALLRAVLLAVVVAQMGANRMIPIQVTRNTKADTFVLPGSCREEEMCLGGAEREIDLNNSGSCLCRCPERLPVFREDVHLCVDDIHECQLVPFVTGTTYQKMPFVYLPLKGQIIYPSAEITFTGMTSPICVISGAKFLTRNGWVDLRNKSDSDAPFRLFRDEGKTFLQWLGDSELRINMEGRLALVYLMCKDMGDGENQDSNIITPCVAFKIAGSPSDPSSWTGIKEVLFSTDSNSRTEGMGSGYVAIAICSLLLGLVYVASVMLYLQARKRQTEHRDSSPAVHITVSEEGIVKNNPLLRHCHENITYLTDTAPSCSDSDDCSDVLPLSDDSGCNVAHSVQVTSAMVHPCSPPKQRERQKYEPMQLQDTTNIERLPEENVSIVETLGNREEIPDTIRVIACTNTRRKLYFNPAYFEPELLMTPPPAAVEFLTKIREVVSIAKAKIEAKKFLPTLIGIPEENETLRHKNSIAGSESAISLKRDNSRRKSSNSCMDISEKINFGDIPGCHNCSSTINENKQRSIRQWLENVPVAKSGDDSLTPLHTGQAKTTQNLKHLTPIKIHSEDKLLFSPADNTSSKYYMNDEQKNQRNCDSSDSLRQKQYFNAIKQQFDKPYLANDTNKYHRSEDEILQYYNCPPPPPSLCSNTSLISGSEKNNKLISIPNIAKKLKDAITKETEEHLEGNGKKQKPSPPVRLDSLNNRNTNFVKDHQQSNDNKIIQEYDTDSLERTQEERKCGFSTPSDYGDIETQNILSFDNQFLNDTLIERLSAITKKQKENDDHEYEVIMIGPENSNNKALTDILNRNEGYSLISEVYVNDGYFQSSPSSLQSNTSTNSFESDSEIICHKETIGHLTIQVEAPKTYQCDDSDSFEPDTLDRKPNKLNINNECNKQQLIDRDCYNDSLERPFQISLKTTGSFRSDTLSWCGTSYNSDKQGGSTLNRKFGSLREIFEAKNKLNQCTHNRALSTSPLGSTTSLNTENRKELKLSWKHGKPKLLNPEERVAKRQREPSPPNDPTIKPPQIKLLHHNTSNNLEDDEQCPPLPPRLAKPILPPKNDHVRNICGDATKVSRRPLPALPSKTSKSAHYPPVDASGNSSPSSDYEPMTLIGETAGKVYNEKSRKDVIHIQGKKANKQRRPHSRMHHRTEDSGYLSTDSNCSDVIRKEESVSETDDSFFDGASESGAESIATDSFFFGKFHTFSKSKQAENFLGPDVPYSDSDSNISHITVLPSQIGID